MYSTILSCQKYCVVRRDLLKENKEGIVKGYRLGKVFKLWGKKADQDWIGTCEELKQSENVIR